MDISNNQLSGPLPSTGPSSRSIMEVVVASNNQLSFPVVGIDWVSPHLTGPTYGWQQYGRTHTQGIRILGTHFGGVGCFSQFVTGVLPEAYTSNGFLPLKVFHLADNLLEGTLALLCYIS